MQIRKNPALGTRQLAESDSAGARDEKAGADRVPCRKNAVLIVDDDQAVRQVFQFILSSNMPGLAIDQAADGAEAVECFRSGHHAVVLMDLFMPVMDGEKAYFEIERICDEANWAMPAVVFCTGHNPSPRLSEIVISDPRHCMLEKPVRNELLVETVGTRLKS